MDGFDGKKIIDGSGRAVLVVQMVVYVGFQTMLGEIQEVVSAFFFVKFGRERKGRL